MKILKEAFQIADEVPLDNVVKNAGITMPTNVVLAALIAMYAYNASEPANENTTPTPQSSTEFNNTASTEVKILEPKNSATAAICCSVLMFGALVSVIKPLRNATSIPVTIPLAYARRRKDNTAPEPD